jgi:predicted lipase
MKHLLPVDQKHLLKSAHASKMTYDNKPLISTPTVRMLTLSRSNAQVHIVTYPNSNRHMIAFKGTSCMKGIIAFCNARPVRFNFRDASVQVHSGMLRTFWQTEKEMTEYLFDDVMAKHTAPIDITFCGHSMGGCLAMFASAYYSSIFPNKIVATCHTFGAPRMGDESFHAWMTDAKVKSINVVNQSDIAPNMPHTHTPNPNTLFLHDPQIDSNPWDGHSIDAYIQNLHHADTTLKLCLERFDVL